MINSLYDCNIPKGLKSAKNDEPKIRHWKKKTKAQRQEWWKNLTEEERTEYIERRQAKKAEQRAKRPPVVLKYNPKYPWITEGVNKGNRERWLAMIHKKNPWLKMGIRCNIV